MLNDYVLKSSLPSIPSNDALDDYALDDYALKTQVSDVSDLNTLTTNVNTQLQGKVDNSDLADYYSKTGVVNGRGETMREGETSAFLCEPEIF